MVDEKAIERSKMKEGEYVQLANEKQAEIDQIKQAEQQRQEEPQSNNIFKIMKNMFERKKAEGELQKQTAQYVKKQYEDQIAQAKRDRYLQEQTQKQEEKLAYERMTAEEKAAITKQKIGKFTDKITAGLGQAKGSSIVNTAGNFIDREYGQGASVERGGQGGFSGLPSGDRIANMMGGRVVQSQQQTKGKQGITPNDRFSQAHLSGFLGNKRVAAEQPLNYLPRSNVGNIGPRAGQYLGAQVSGKKNYAASFGASGPKTNFGKLMGSTNTQRDVVGRKSNIKGAGLQSVEGYGGLNYGAKVHSILGGMSTPKITGKTSKKTTNVNINLPESSVVKINRMLGK